MIYVKLIDGKLEYAPQGIDIILNGRRIFNPTDKDYINAGYKTLVYDVTPEITMYQRLEPVYTDNETNIGVSYNVIDFTEEEKQALDKQLQEEQALQIQAEIKSKTEQVKNIVTQRYQEKLNELHPYNQYYIKAMFADKYTIAYVTLIDEGTDIINLSIYDTENTLINIDMTFEEFQPLYRAVKNIAVEIEKEYQQALADLSLLKVEKDVTIILEKLNKYLE